MKHLLGRDKMSIKRTIKKEIGIFCCCQLGGHIVVHTEYDSTEAGQVTAFKCLKSWCSYCLNDFLLLIFCPYGATRMFRFLWISEV